MARAAITVNNVTTTASATPSETSGDATNGHYINGNDGNVMLTVRNADVSNPHTLSIGFPTYHGQAVDPIDYPIPASATRDIRVGPASIHGTRAPIDADSSQIKIIARKLA